MNAERASHRPRLLVVEDDRTLARGLEMNLELEGFEVLLAADGEEGLRLAIDEQPDLIVLDLMLPELDGFDVVTELRSRARSTPVIVLSARGEVRDKTDALALGADDYVTKPFSLDELVARIKAALRRPAWHAETERRIRFGQVEVALEARTVRRDDDEIELTPKEFDLLAFMVSHPRRVHSRERLLDAVWSYDYEGTARTVDNFVRALRVKLEDNPAEPRYLVTVRGAGYRFEP